MSSTHTLAYAQNTKEKGGGGKQKDFTWQSVHILGSRKKMIITGQLKDTVNSLPTTNASKATHITDYTT